MDSSSQITLSSYEDIDDLQLSCIGCDDCGLFADEVIQIYSKENVPITFPICMYCLVGKDIPVYRPHNRLWQIGEVKYYDKKKQLHFFCFLDGNSEWLYVSSANPHEEYLKSHLRLEAKQSSINRKKTSINERKESSQVHTLDHFPNSEMEYTRPMKRSRLVISEVRRELSQIHTLNQSPDSEVENARPVIRSRLDMIRSQDHEHCHQPRYLGEELIMTKSSRRNNKNQRKKTCPRLWTPEEDLQLLHVVKSTSPPLKWPEVAKSLPNRTGKQCRERYLNHLSPKLKLVNWTPEEDSTIITLYLKFGPQWANMSKMIKGRTDNSIKNRFHHQRRRMEKDEMRVRKFRTLDMFHKDIRLERIRPSYRDSSLRSDLQCRIHQMIGYLAAQSVLGNGVDGEYRFGPWKIPESKQCNRCQFFVPSVQCGTKIYEKTNWCEACTRIPAYITGDVLRECLNLRKRC